jgi:pimeloyl-ACP methyl ester carboxylesterase
MICIGCNQMLAERVVRAPNLSQAVHRGEDASADELKKLYVDRQVRVSVGPPDATISVWITEPSKAHEDFWFDGKGNADIRRKPSTQPATQPASQPVCKGTIFLLHGILDNKAFGPYILYREALTHQGYRVVQIDHRGHGRSTGDFISFGAIEKHDMVQVLDALEQQSLITANVGVVGVSYGAAIAIQWAAIDPRVKAVVAVEPYSSLREVARDGAPLVLGPGKFFYSDKDINKTVTIAGQIAHFNPDDASTVDAIAQMRTPVLLIHSRADTFVPYGHSQRLHDAAPDHSKLILVDGQSHFDIWLKSFDLINGASFAWFKKYLRQAEHESARITTNLHE